MSATESPEITMGELAEMIVRVVGKDLTIVPQAGDAGLADTALPGHVARAGVDGLCEPR